VPPVHDRSESSNNDLAQPGGPTNRRCSPASKRGQGQVDFVVPLDQCRQQCLANSCELRVKRVGAQ